MFRKYIFIWMLLISFEAFSQNSHLLKTNIAAPLTNIYSLQYEYKIGQHFGFNNTFFYRQKSLLPFGEHIDRFASDHGVGLTGIKFNNILIDEAKMGLKGYSPELRIYFSQKKNKPFVGFFGMYSDFDMKVPANMLLIKEGYLLEVIMPVNFKFQTLSGGILIGKQFSWNRFGLDIVIMGPHIGKVNNFYGFSKNSNIKELDETERAFFIENLKERFGLNEKYFSLDLETDAAEIKAKRTIPYIGVRGLGVNFWVKF